MTARVALASLIMAASLGGAAAQTYSDFARMSCRELWAERNQIYRVAGYCFQTKRAIDFFGNAGCVYDRQADVPLDSYQRQRLADIMRAERSRGCTD